MDIDAYAVPAIVSLSVAGATFGACRWWYGRRLREALARLDKVRQGHQTAGQHAQQARKQIEQLQKELQSQRRPRNEREGSPPRDAPAAAPSAAERKLLQLERAALSRPPALPANGFADTQPMCVRPLDPSVRG